ncbi:hypothetical protein CVT25_009065 [Psilocybe cyanescens]|uniref:DUF4139 domain-containing protein n=1 Tax=Psilocybe cyanescens TaxID=93625 RepID=A0A409XDR5_PSICY|nr:hypothetical protein CVT25_009065 [Psilocybe cyanescens]
MAIKRQILDLKARWLARVRFSKLLSLDADWTPGYDIRVDTKAKEQAVTIMYKASITQNTGESWDNAPLTLETVTPSFGITSPVLHSWRLAFRFPFAAFPLSVSCSRLSDSPVFANYSSASRLPLPSRLRFLPQIKEVLLRHLQIPGLINVPSDGGKLSLSSSRTRRYCASDARVHLKSIAVQNFKIVDRVLVSEDKKIEVLNLTLSTPSANSAPAKNYVQDTNNVVVQWEGVEEGSNTENLAIIGL